MYTRAETTASLLARPKRQLLAHSANSPPFLASPAYRSETGRPDVTMYLRPFGRLSASSAIAAVAPHVERAGLG